MNDNWSITLDETGTPYTAQVTVSETDLAAVARKLAGLINSATGYTAAADGTAIAIVRLAGGVFTITPSAPSGCEAASGLR